MRRVDIALGVLFGSVAEETLELGKGRELAHVDEGGGRHVLGNVRSAAVNRNTARIKAIEQLLGDVAGKSGVLVHQGKPIARQQLELVLDRTAVRALGGGMQARLDRRVAAAPTLAVQVEVGPIG